MSGKLFGTNGVRGVANAEVTPDLALRLGKAVASWLKPGDLVAVGRDARTTGPMLAGAATAGLLSAGARVVELGIAPTPAFQYYVKSRSDVAAGVVVTASHNPPEFNGIKLIAPDGTETSAEEEATVEALYFAERFRTVPWDRVAQPTSDDATIPTYLKAIRSHVDEAATRRRKLKVVVDTGGGPGGLVTPKLLRELGCHVVTLHEALDGAFTGRKSEPTEDNLGKLKELVVKERADLGLAHDGDADRCIFIDEQGGYVPGDVSLALFAREALRIHPHGLVMTPVSTSSLLEDVVRAAGGVLQTTPVGSPILARAMIRDQAVYGGEENGGIIFPEHQFCRDAAMTASKMVELLAQQGRSLSGLTAELPKYYVFKVKFPVPEAQKQRILTDLRAWVSAHYPQARVDPTDGLKVYVDDAWVLIRPSGTEALYRVFAESKKVESARKLAEQFVKVGRELAAK